MIWPSVGWIYSFVHETHDLIGFSKIVESGVFHVKNLHPYEKMKKYLKQMSKKRETLLDNMEDDELEEYREIWGSDPSLKNLGYDSGEAKKLKKTDDLYIFFWSDRKSIQIIEIHLFHENSW